MGLVEVFSLAARIVLLLAGLLLPGALLLRALRLPCSLAGSFIASAVALYVGLVVLATLRAPISLFTLAGMLGAVSLAAFVVARRTAVETPDTGEVRGGAFLTELGGWTPLYAAFWLVIAWRLATQPLNGGDVDFRWGWLAEQMLKQASLNFYPPLAAADFGHYFWVESIPPGAAGLHAWCYACGGSTAAAWTSLGVGLQVLALHDLIWRIASAWGGRSVARRAVLLAAAAPLLNWSVIIGQETGLTALACVGLIYASIRWREGRADRWAIFAALAAVLGASTREYGLAFVLLGLALLALHRAPWRTLGLYLATALPLAVLWPARVWALTGNPFYSLAIGHLFPTNSVFVEWANSISSGSTHLFSTLDGWSQLLRYLVLCVPAALLCWAAVAIDALRRKIDALACTVVILLVGALWYASVPYTGGGLFYSMRLLSPAFALGALYGADFFSRSATTRQARVMLDAGIFLVVAVTLPMTLTLPHNAYRLPLSDWPDVGRLFTDARKDADAEVARQLLTMPGHERILSECVSLPNSLAASGITVVPMWSPEVAWLFDHRSTDAEVARKWRESGLRYVVMTRSPAQLALLARRAQWATPYFSIKPVWQSSGYILFEIRASSLLDH